MSSRRIDILCAVGLSFATVLVVAVTAQTLGFTRDEGYYFKAGELYWGWFRDLFAQPSFALSNVGIDKYWQYNHEHPAILKTMFALSFGAREVLGLPVQTHDALRFPAWIVAGASTALVFALARSLLPRRAAIVAALLWIAMPHVFWHMHVACFDVGVAAAHCALVLAYWRWRHTLRGALLVGVVFGVAAGVKHNVLPVPALLVLHWLLTEARTPSSAPSSAPSSSGARGLALPPVPLVFFSLAIVGPVVFLLHWPWLWPDPARRWGSYIAYHLQHEHYPILYFGDLLTAPPFPSHFPFVMSAVTIPVPTLAAMALGTLLAVVVVMRSLRWRLSQQGAAQPRRGDEEATMVPLGDVARAPSSSAALLLLINAAYPFLLIALPSTPIFGGTKHWMNALPFLCVLAAWALEETLRRFSVRRSMPAAVVFVVVALVALPGAIISARVWPYGLGSYNELIGFTRGAANVGMQRTFWGYEPMAALDEVNAHEPRVKRIHFGDTNNDDYRMYKRDSLLRADIAFSNTVRGSDVACVQPQGEFKQQWLDVWNEWGDRSPDIVHHAEGVPVATCTFRVPSRPSLQGSAR